jgi:DNA invertase Pin-like site-specific DNA recombinase
MRNHFDRLWKCMAALVYLRCSKDEQEDSVEGQRRIVDTELSGFGMKLLAPPFIDDGRRGSDEERPGLLALLEFCRSHPVQSRAAADFVPIFVQSTDRLGRFLDPMKIFTYLNEFKELGYDVYSITEKMRYVGGHIGDWIQMVVRSDQATGYSVRLSHDSLRGGLQTAERGHLAGGQAGYGFDRVVVGADGKPRCRYVNLPGKRVAKYSLTGEHLGTLEPVLRKGKLVSPSLDKSNSDHVERVLGDPLKVKAVRRLWELYIEKRYGFRTVADALNREGYPPPGGRKWFTSAIRSILTSAIYMGTGVYGRRSKSKYHEFSVVKSVESSQIRIDKKEIFGKGFLYRELEECVLQPNAHPAIVSADQWYSAQEILASKVDENAPKRPGRGARSNYLLTGLAKCALCTFNYQGHTHRRTGWRSYQCGGYVNGGKSVCRRNTVPGDRIEDWVLTECGERLLDGRAGLFESYEDFETAIEQEVTSQFPVEVPVEDRRKMLELKLAEKRKRIEFILTGLSEDNLDVANEAIRGLKREVSGIEGQIREEKDREKPRLKVDPKAVAREGAKYLWNIKEVLEKGTIEERRKFIEYLVQGARINGVEAWVEVSFYENPRLPGGTFCMVPPTGFEPVSRT